MKKYLILFIVAGFFSLVACSDDEIENNPDPIVGTWVLIEVTPASPILDPSVCDPSSITFKKDGSAAASFFVANKDCELIASPGSWEHKDGSTYTISVPLVGSQDVTVNFDGSGKFSLNFQDTNLTFERKTL